MDNAQVARTLEQIALLLELEDGNPFRINAYRNAATTVHDHPRPMAELVSEGYDLTQLDFIGKDLAATIQEYVQTGRLRLLDEISQRVPLSLLEVLRIPGLGPRKVKKLWHALGVSDLDGLEAMAREGRIVEVEGFGKQSQESILRRIQRLREREAEREGREEQEDEEGSAQ